MHTKNAKQNKRAKIKRIPCKNSAEINFKTHFNGKAKISALIKKRLKLIQKFAAFAKQTCFNLF